MNHDGVRRTDTATPSLVIISKWDKSCWIYFNLILNLVYFLIKTGKVPRE